MDRIRVTNTCAVALIYWDRNPRNLFIEVKDDGHPMKLVRRQLCPIGGNWIGPAALADRSPRDTCVRELLEELSFERPLRSSLELGLLGHLAEGDFAPTPEPTIAPDPAAVGLLADLKGIITSRLEPVVATINTVTTEALRRADPEYPKEGFTFLANYFGCPLGDDEWIRLAELQRTYGNLSNESVTLTVRLEQILAQGTKLAFGHDVGLRTLLLGLGVHEASRIATVNGVSYDVVGMPAASYEEVLAAYDVARRPQP